jgi:hypothetical protein
MTDYPGWTFEMEKPKSPEIKLQSSLKKSRRIADTKIQEALSEHDERVKKIYNFYNLNYYMKDKDDG